jgi:hypothetical protein
VSWLLLLSVGRPAVAGLLLVGSAWLVLLVGWCLLDLEKLELE